MNSNAHLGQILVGEVILLSHLAFRWGFPTLHLVQAKIQKGHDYTNTRRHHSNTARPDIGLASSEWSLDERQREHQIRRQERAGISSKSRAFSRTGSVPRNLAEG